MATRYRLTQGVDLALTLVADVCEKIDAKALEGLKRFMYEDGCASGLLFDEEVCVLLRDTFRDASVGSILEERRIPTSVLLATLGAGNAGPLVDRVGLWLKTLATSWRAAVPADSPDAQELIDDVVPAAVGAAIHS